VKFQVLLHPKAVSALKKLDRPTAREIKKKLADLKTNPNSGKRLKYSDFLSLRVGDYRAIYEIDRKEKRIIVLYIGHRKNVYEDFSRMF
jgi:mRNA interferase RelE/StbE